MCCYYGAQLSEQQRLRMFIERYTQAIKVQKWAETQHKSDARERTKRQKKKKKKRQMNVEKRKRCTLSIKSRC